MILPLGLLGLSILIALLAVQAGLMGATIGVALVGVTGLLTSRLLHHSARLYDASLGQGIARPRAIAADSAPDWVSWARWVMNGVDTWINAQEKSRGSVLSEPVVGGQPTYNQAMAMLKAVPGITTGSDFGFHHSEPFARLNDGTVVRTWKNLVGVNHVFLTDGDDQLLYAGFAGWIHAHGLQRAIAQIKRELT